MTSFSLDFSPLIAWPLLAALAVAALVVVALGLLAGQRRSALLAQHTGFKAAVLDGLEQRCLRDKHTGKGSECMPVFTDRSAAGW